MVAVLTELEARPLSRRPDGSRRRGLLAAVDEYVAGPHVVPALATTQATPLVRPLPRPATVRPAPRPSAAPAAMAQVYLWRRVAVGALVAVALVLSSWAMSVLGGVSLVTSEHRATPVSYVVQPGDSYWSVAQRVAPNEDPRAVVANLERARGGAPLLPGQTIVWAR